MLLPATSDLSQYDQMEVSRFYLASGTTTQEHQKIFKTKKQPQLTRTNTYKKFKLKQSISSWAVVEIYMDNFTSIRNKRSKYVPCKDFPLWT